MELRPDEKFALIAFNSINLHHSFPNTADLGFGYFATRKLPGAPDEHWREWLGTIQTKNLEDANLYIGRRIPSKTPQILDGENVELQNDVNAFYWSIFISDFVRNHDTPMHLTGTMLKTGMNVRQVGKLEFPFHIPGTPLNPQIDVPRLELSVKLAQSLRAIFSHKDHSRLKRVIHAFSAGMKASFADVRLHQFVRCIEGFILPEIGKTRKQFISRSQLFVGPKHHDSIGKLFDLRSNAEHLHEVLDLITAPTKSEKLISLFHHSFEAEGLAKYCLSTLLLNAALRPYFEDDLVLSSFWALDEASRTQLWGNQLNFTALSKRFEAKYIREEELGD